MGRTGVSTVDTQKWCSHGGKYSKKPGVPDSNLANTHVLVHPDDLRRLDLVVPGLHVGRGLPLFCDVTIEPYFTEWRATIGNQQSGR